jgi:hypothetical protein
MREEIYIIIQPGIMEQTVYVFSEMLETIPLTLTSPMGSLADTILSAAQKYNICNIKIKGTQAYNQKIKEDILMKQNIYFANADLIIDLI